MKGWRGLRSMDPEERAQATLDEHEWARRPPRDGGLMDQPALVLVGQHLANFDVFDQDARRAGSFRMVSRGWTRFHYELRDVKARHVLTCRGTFGRLWWAGTFSVCDPNGAELAALDRMHWHPLHTVRPITADGEPLGRLRLPHFPATLWAGANEGQIADRTGRTMASIKTYVGVGDTYFIEMHDDLMGPLRHTAVAASILWDNRMLARR